MPDRNDCTPGTDQRRQMCAVCRARLNPVQHPDGTWSFVHGVFADHEARPVNEVLADSILICDFCLTPHPTWDFPCGEVGAIIGIDKVAVSVSDWASCNQCHDLIETGRYSALVDRILANRSGVDPSLDDMIRRSPALEMTIRMSLVKQMADFAEARTGPPIPIQQAQWVAAKLSTMFGDTP